jgi:hypothetical protein
LEVRPTKPKGAIFLYNQYTIDQLFLPMDLEEDLPQKYLVRLINAID